MSDNAQPQYSADGKWWWNGEQWIAVDANSAQPRYSDDGRWYWNGKKWDFVTTRSPSIFWPVLGAMIAFVVIAFFVLTLVGNLQRSKQASDEFDRMACEEYGYCEEP